MKGLIQTGPLRWLAIGFLLCGAPGIALASGGAKAGHGSERTAHGAQAAAPVQPLDPRVVNIAVLVAPVVDRGELTGYLYLSVDLKAKTESDAAKIKSDLPLIQDAFLRALYAHPVERNIAESKGVEATLESDLKAASAGLIDASILESLKVLSIVRVPL
jgi:flagellar basal body-associated protein FliL